MARRTRITRRGYIVLGMLPALLAFGVVVGAGGAGAELRPEGVGDDRLVGADELPTLQIRVVGVPGDRLAAVQLTLDGAPVEGRVVGGSLVYRPPRLADGEHELRVLVDRPFLLPAARSSWSFEVDTTPPELTLEAPEEVPVDEPVRVEGVTEPGATVINGEDEVPSDAEGRFALSLEYPPSEPLEVAAVDAAGNRTVQSHRFRLAVPPVRAVHMTAISWAADVLREPVLEMIDEGKLTAIELDLKDESGVVGFDSRNEFAQQIGAVRPEYKLEEAVEFLHDKGVRVIGRIVVFRDPILAEAAWKAGDHDWVIQTPNGSAPFGKYGGFTNFAHPDVWDYNIAIAEEAAERGVDEILWDYVRRPDAYLDQMKIPVLKTTPEQAIVDFLAEGRKRLRPKGVVVGASVFGVAATRPKEIAQDIPAMSREVDYIAPMVYPSHWAKGEYKVANPNAQPYDIVYRSLEDFQRIMEGTGARLVPWLQDFTLGVRYGPAEVRAQIKAAADLGIDEWLLWDAAVTYTAGALEPDNR